MSRVERRSGSIWSPNGTFHPARLGTYWRRQTGFVGTVVEVVLWVAAATWTLKLLNWTLIALLWLLERA